ncbi:hypothetical protein [Rhodoblastus sp.]|uniref:hypothetical protein n=1 Tax=Rhodoblastus sp. TaxID=1962975 RepID=UPI0026213103|nr:hypothetical protein [Rhodoblastus sp.]
MRQWRDRDFALASDKQLERGVLGCLGGNAVAGADSRESPFELASQMRDLAPCGDFFDLRVETGIHLDLPELRFPPRHEPWADFGDLNQ